ncbi:MAG TPA: two-component sensor histidine kinase, partial [Thermopolyspora sp.]
MVAQIVVVTTGLGLLIAGLGLAVLWILRSRSIGVMLAVVAVVTIAATLAGVVAIILAMAIEKRSRDIVLTVVAIAGLVGLGVAVVLARRVVKAGRRLAA